MTTTKTGEQSDKDGMTLQVFGHALWQSLREFPSALHNFLTALEGIPLWPPRAFLRAVIRDIKGEG